MKRIEKLVTKDSIEYTSSIRSRNSIVRIILKIMNIVMQMEVQNHNSQDGMSLSDTDTLKENNVGFILRVDKMSRVFLISKHKIHTFNFPFSIKIIDNKYIFHSQGLDIDSITLSFLVSIYYDLKDSNSFFSLEDAFYNEFTDYHFDDSSVDFLSSLVGILQTFEVGYLRYDNDNDEERINEFSHPINHLDINYSNSVTYKFGLNNTLDCKELEDILTPGTECRFIVESQKNQLKRR